MKRIAIAALCALVLAAPSCARSRTPEVSQKPPPPHAPIPVADKKLSTLGAWLMVKGHLGATRSCFGFYANSPYVAIDRHSLRLFLKNGQIDSYGFDLAGVYQQPFRPATTAEKSANAIILTGDEFESLMQVSQVTVTFKPAKGPWRQTLVSVLDLPRVRLFLATCKPD